MLKTSFDFYLEILASPSIGLAFAFTKSGNLQTNRHIGWDADSPVFFYEVVFRVDDVRFFNTFLVDFIEIG